MSHINLPSHRSLRLKNYDYSGPGYYFITICVQNRECLFGKIINEQMILNDVGRMIIKQLQKLIYRFNNFQLHEFITMPNHFHCIIERRGAPCGYPFNRTIAPMSINTRVPTRGTPTIGDIIGAFKSLTTNEYIQQINNNNWQPFNKRLWQNDSLYQP